jgi:hypothetical protein
MLLRNNDSTPDARLYLSRPSQSARWVPLIFHKIEDAMVVFVFGAFLEIGDPIAVAVQGGEFELDVSALPRLLIAGVGNPDMKGGGIKHRVQDVLSMDAMTLRIITCEAE